MTLSKHALNTLIAGAFATTLASGAATPAAAAETEKCYGVVKAGHNDCHAADGSHSCATMATEDASGSEWISVPEGLCEKLAGGSLAPIKADEKAQEPEEDAPAEDDVDES
jgi:uncharacterized membrane protein